MPETNLENLGTFENHMSSLKLKDGCIFKGYNNVNNVAHMFTTNDDMEDLKTFDNQISSFSCECTTCEIFDPDIMFLFYIIHTNHNHTNPL